MAIEFLEAKEKQVIKKKEKRNKEIEFFTFKLYFMKFILKFLEINTDYTVQNSESIRDSLNFFQLRMQD